MNPKQCIACALAKLDAESAVLGVLSTVTTFPDSASQMAGRLCATHKPQFEDATAHAKRGHADRLEKIRKALADGWILHDVHGTVLHTVEEVFAAWERDGSFVPVGKKS